MIQRVYVDGSWWMVRYKCVTHQRVNYILDRLQFLGSSITNDLRDDQILTVRNDLPSHRNRTSMVSTSMAQVIQTTTSLSEGLPVIDDTSTMTTWVKGCQLSTIRPTWVKGCQLSTIRPTWVNGCQLSTIRPTWVKGCQLSMIRPTWVKGCQLSTIRPTWVKGCQLSTIRVRKWPVWLMTYVVNDLCGRYLTLCTLGRVGKLIDYEKQVD